MDKYSKLKTFNTIVFVLVPLFLIAIFTGFILANGMSSNKEANNTIAIGSIGTVTATVNLTAANSQIYPGATNKTLTVTFNYTGGKGITKLNLQNFRTSDFKTTIGTTNYNLTNDVITFTNISDVTNWVVSSNKTHNLTFSVKAGYDGFTSDVPSVTMVNGVQTLNYLLNPITEISFTLTFDVTDAGV